MKISSVRSHSTGRVLSIDVLRGAAILLMILSGLLPKTLPNWFDHGYNPHYLPDAAGVWTMRPEVASGASLYLRGWMSFTWVDLVFPMFLFAMGAAIPAALTKRLSISKSRWSTAGSVFGRWWMLIFFALFVTHLTVDHLTSTNADTSRMRTIGSLLIAFFFFVRWPDAVPVSVQRIIRIAAFVMIFIRIGANAVRDDDLISWKEADIIILVLAHTYLVASLLWLFTQRMGWLRLVVIAPVALLAHYLQFAGTSGDALQWMGPIPADWTHHAVSWIPKVLNFPNWVPGLTGLAHDNRWIQDLTDLSPAWNFSWLKYLWVVVPGTIAGDWLMGWSTRQTIEADDSTDRARGSAWLLPLAILVCVGAFVGLRHYGFGPGNVLNTPTLALLLCIPPLVAMFFINHTSAFGHFWVNRKLGAAGCIFTLVGLALACLPIFHGTYLEHGITKGPPSTMSYYLLTTGLCLLLIQGLVPWFDHNRLREPVSALALANGQNALLAYFIAHATAPAVWGLSIFAAFGLPFGESVRSLNDAAHHLLTGTGGAVAWAFIQTLAIAIVVYFATRLRWVWRV